MNTLKSNKTKRAVTISEASVYACVSEATVRNWIATGLLPYEELPGCGKGINKMRRIRKSDIDEFLDNHYIKTKPSRQKMTQDTLLLLPKE